MAKQDRYAEVPRRVAAIPVEVATATSVRPSWYSAERSDRMRGSARTRRSTSAARAILSAVAVAATSSRHRSSSTASTPSGPARPACSSGVEKAALSRASTRVAATREGSSDPDQAKPTRPPRTTRRPTPSEVAEDSCSTSPPLTSTDRSVPRIT